MAGKVKKNLKKVLIMRCMPTVVDMHYEMHANGSWNKGRHRCSCNFAVGLAKTQSR